MWKLGILALSVILTSLVSLGGIGAWGSRPSEPLRPSIVGIAGGNSTEAGAPSVPGSPITDTSRLVDLRIPVNLDGVWYEPEEFNRIHKELYSKGIYLKYVPTKEGLYAFTTYEKANEILPKLGMRPIQPPPQWAKTGKLRGGIMAVVPDFNQPPPPPERPMADSVNFEGIWYQPQEFDRIRDELYSKGTYLIFVYKDEEAYAVTTLEKANEFLANLGLPPIRQNH